MADALTQIVDKLKECDNVLVTVNSSPSVDELSAALGITLLINKINKHATAVFSGAVPPAIDFLQPEKTFEHTVDSLRDFIIALDKEKADHLRYKVVDDMVKIFITPYRTTINEKDLDFSQGDYNVEAVLAIGVQNEADLDHALESHGRILHDATVAAISLGEATKLGGIEWNNPRASSYSEMLYQLAEKLTSDKKHIDEQIATAFLTGIVAATERFSNDKTSSTVMTVAATLMAAGANQQLIATKLQEGAQLQENADETSGDQAQEDESVKVSSMVDDKDAKKNDKKAKDDDSIGTLAISHVPEGDVDEVKHELEEKRSREALDAAHDMLAKKTADTETKLQKDAAELAEQKLAEQLAAVPEIEKPAAKPSVEDIQQDIARASGVIDETAAPVPAVPVAESIKTQLPDVVEPTLGGTLNATTEQAADDARRAVEDDRNRVILSHGGDSYASGQSATQAPLNAVAASVDAEPTVPDVFAQGSVSAPTDHAATIHPPEPIAPEVSPALSAADGQSAIDAALAAVSQASDAQAAAAPSSITPDANSEAATLPSLPPMPPLPPMPNFSTLPPLPTTESAQPSDSLASDKLESTLPPLSPAAIPTAASDNDPSQFRIPGQ